MKDINPGKQVAGAKQISPRWSKGQQPRLPRPNGLAMTESIPATHVARLLNNNGV
ncbi:MAG: hypothetical protein K8R02_06890 [Anaerohalosphaeraceae bacterium]|nr:hypothetical protein [Anaerohalosphaeraceae bacterium]